MRMANIPVTCLADTRDKLGEGCFWDADTQCLWWLDAIVPSAIHRLHVASGAYRRMRIFAGYAGWEAGQLERELELDMWQVVPALIDDVFDTRPGSLWRRVLRRQGGDLALLSTWTANAELN